MPIPLPPRVVIINIDGLRHDAFHEVIHSGKVPNLQRIIGTNAYSTMALSTAPSVTFAAQASIVTGAHPGQHGITGNQLFDRFGRANKGKPRYYGFDVGDTLAYDDAVAVFANDLADKMLHPETLTIYETAAKHGKHSLVVFHMYGRGAQQVIRPSVVSLGRFKKGKGIFGLKPEDYDKQMLEQLGKALSKGNHKPDLVLAYFMGLDSYSHGKGPEAQRSYLQESLDPMIGALLEQLNRHAMVEGTLFVIVSDHGQVATPGDDEHTLRLGFPFDREMADFFSDLKLNVHDVPGESPNVDAVVALNGGLAHVYLRHYLKDWSIAPRYHEDVLPVAQAFFEANATGRYCIDIRDTLDGVLIRNVEEAGDWTAPYSVYLGNGQTERFEEWLSRHPDINYVDAANRVRLSACANSGDLILMANPRKGVYFGGPGLSGVHGSLAAGDSQAVLALSLLGASGEEAGKFRGEVERLVRARCAAEGDRQPSVADTAYLLRALWLGLEP